MSQATEPIVNLLRRPETQRFGPAAFDQASVGLFLLLAQKAGRKLKAEEKHHNNLAA